MSEQKETRQQHGNNIDLTSHPDQDNVENMVNDEAKEFSQLITDRAALEKYHDQVVAAGKDGLHPVAARAMMIGLNHIGYAKDKVSNENYTDINISVEDLASYLKEISKKILAFIEALIAKGKEYASKIMSGIDGVVKEAEELIQRARGKRTRSSNELHDDKTITIGSPGILMVNGELCLDECRDEAEVVKFFQGAWPQYAIDQIKRARKMISEYDVESGNSDNFKSNAEFLGNHKSLVARVEDIILPGDKKIGFKYVALGPELIDADNVKESPSSYTLDVRDSTTIVKTLRDNIEHMKSMAKMFSAEANVLQEMRGLSQSVADLENRRGETIFKGARDDLDTISTMVMGLVNRLKPNYDPIVRHLAKVGTARNAVCRQELEAQG